jgi:hypothetical protein
MVIVASFRPYVTPVWIIVENARFYKASQCRIYNIIIK